MPEPSDLWRFLERRDNGFRFTDGVTSAIFSETKTLKETMGKKQGKTCTRFNAPLMCAWEARWRHVDGSWYQGR